MTEPGSLKRKISPPPVRKSSARGTVLERTREVQISEPDTTATRPTLAAIEAGEAKIRDHLAYFSSHLQQVKRLAPQDAQRLAIRDYQDLYQRNSTSHGRHFVVHQHDHPVSGVHYDLRLQFSDTSSISFAIPYGLPGNPNSLRPNRMAIETRVHNLWNNLIESASHATGSLLIWDTGEFEVLPRHLHTTRSPQTDDELSADSTNEEQASPNDHWNSTKLFKAFQTRHIRLRLHGTRLPQGYTISLRLPSANNNTQQPSRPKHKRRRKALTAKPRLAGPIDSGSDTESSTSAPQLTAEEEQEEQAANASEGEDEDETIRLNNAYPGATNTIGSIHQRHWFLTLDRVSSGFVKVGSGPDKGRWVPNTDARKGAAAGFETFFVQGREYERSIVTGRLAQDVMDDEGITMYMGRKMWRPITE